MIADRIECAGMYGGLGERIALGLSLLGEERVLAGEPGRYEVDGDRIYYVIDTYLNRPTEQSHLESHRKYLDIQYVVSGREWIGCCPVEGLAVDRPYDVSKDVEFYKPASPIGRVLMTEGMFAIFFPHDAHMPGQMVERPEQVKKIVVKIRVE